MVVVAVTLVARRQLAPEAPRLPASEQVWIAPPPLPSPTPLPWLGSSIATVVREGRSESIALIGAVPGARPARLVGGFEFVRSLAWSPDGDRLAFAARRDGNWNVLVARADGGEVRNVTADAAFEGWPAWSPDGLELAYVSYGEDGLAVYRRALTDGAAPERVSGGDAPAIEPAWSPDGAWIAYAVWSNPGYRLEAVRLATGERHVLAEPREGRDLRAPAWSPDGTRLSYLDVAHGVGLVVARDWEDAAGALRGPTTTLAMRASAHAWFPGGDAIAVAMTGRSERVLELRTLEGRAVDTLAELPPGPAAISWSRRDVAETLARIEPERPLGAAEASGDDPRPGLALLTDVRVPGARIHAGLAGDFADLRADVLAETGRDFLGTLSDGWRPLGFKSSGSAFFSWHKTGRAFDTQMELWGPGGRRDMVLVREEHGGRTMWRMYLRAGTQDGSAGVPLTDAGWTFSAGSGDPSLVPTGGRRGRAVPAGYWVDFTALAERYGWRRIPSLTRGDLAWQKSWTGIEYWHYERRDGLRWFEAARQVYTDVELAQNLHPDRLRTLDVPLRRLAWLGFPALWPDEG